MVFKEWISFFYPVSLQWTKLKHFHFLLISPMFVYEQWSEKKKMSISNMSAHEHQFKRRKVLKSYREKAGSWDLGSQTFFVNILVWGHFVSHITDGGSEQPFSWRHHVDQIPVMFILKYNKKSVWFRDIFLSQYNGQLFLLRYPLNFLSRQSIFIKWTFHSHWLLLGIFNPH